MSEIVEQEEWQKELVLYAKDLVKDIWECNRDGEEFPSRESLTEVERENYLKSINDIYDGLVRGTIWCVLGGHERKGKDSEGS